MILILFFLLQVKIKVEKTKEDEKEGGAEEGEEEKERVAIKVEKEEDDKPLPDGGEAKPESGMGRLVMTVDGQQKQLSFGPNDLLSTATMFDGDKVRVLSSEHRRWY